MKTFSGYQFKNETLLILTELALSSDKEEKEALLIFLRLISYIFTLPAKINDLRSPIFKNTLTANCYTDQLNNFLFAFKEDWHKNNCNYYQ